MITLIILGVIQLRKDNMAIKPRNGGNTSSILVAGTSPHQTNCELENQYNPRVDFSQLFN